MSPEQVRAPEQVDAQSDVYGLGATLYELLTGEPPFRGTPYMVVQRLLHDDPEPPRRLNESVPRDLETICLKALAREPARRYPTATAFGDDLRRFLTGVPVEARPLGSFGRLVRWARRSPKVAGLSAALLLVAVVGFAAVLWQWQRAEAKSVEAQANADAALEQRTRAVTYLEESRENFRDARRAVDTFFSLAQRHNLFNQAQGSPLEKQLLEETLRYYQSFVRRQQDDPSVRAELAEACYRVGMLTHVTGDRAEALTSFHQAVAVYRDLLREQPGDLSARQGMAGCLFQIGETNRNLYRFQEALAAFEEARDEFEQVSRADPASSGLRNSLSATVASIAVLHMQLGHRAEAMTGFEQARKVQEELVRAFPREAVHRLQLARTLNQLGWLAGADSPAGLKYHEQARTVREELHKSDPNNHFYRAELARSFYHLAGGYGQKQLAVALAHLDRAVELLEPAINAEPNIRRYQSDLADVWDVRGRLLESAGRREEALTAYEERRRRLMPLVAASPQERAYRHNLAAINDKISQILRELNRSAEALAALEEELRLLEGLAQESPGEYRTEVAECRKLIDSLRSSSTRPRAK
jgi:tetratricopeptide (TPR) repeat protein